ncbi:hypothetical protein GCM10023190_18290 [Enteractinococcus fodinae]|uniref:ABC-type oligopeptide transport system ATPase subunit n=1 Tax=Enteractinococcus fodinae TaxID=684663 RepID=A0ABU2B486_9MICC|nr:ABC transporter ATP-binding protein [Enteractinococcus fodinae]MDR7348412.1 ABC-type oligopeptide transport system ATPase subunit [Enteractinococcus fodinae]
MKNPNTEPLVATQELNLSFGSAHILKDVSVSLPHNRTVGLVGESGSGKSTLAKAIVGMNRISSGKLMIAGEDMSHPTPAQRKQLYRQIQYVPQDPYSSLNPRRTIGQTMAEALDPMRANPRKHAKEISEALGAMQLDSQSASRYPHEFSGGQRQRIAIARALIVKPKLIVADEITSALDVSVQAEVIRILQELREDMDYSMLFITHNLAVAQAVCDEVVVMLKGQVVESGATQEVFSRPKEEYTRKLLNSVPGAPGFSLV